MQVGYIKLYRKITHSFVWTHPQMFRLWTLCLMKASHKGSKFIFNGQELVVNRGQFITGRVAITKEMNDGVLPEQQVNSSSVWRWLKRFEEEKMLDITSNPKYSVVTIKNWDDYQVNEQQVNNSLTTPEQLSNTYKNVKNVKNDNKDIIINPLQFYEQNGFGTIAPMIVEQVGDWVSEFEQAGNTKEEANLLITKAMEFGVTANARKWGYVNKILMNWKQRGLVTMDKVEAAEAQRAQELEAKKAKPNYSKPPARKESLPEWADETKPKEKDKKISVEEQAVFKERLQKIRAQREG